tara:strand:- start:2017 stop:2463 length:447 start_codon:yes stop_codon:yes gene_type:complete
MKLLTLIYIVLYVSHIFLGPYFIWDFLYEGKVKWASKSWSEVARRSLKMTYVSYLLIALLNQFPSAETFLVAFLLSFLAIIGYSIQYHNSKYFSLGIFDHLFFLSPVLYLYFHYKIDIASYVPSFLSLVVCVYLIFFFFTYKTLYEIK